MKKYSFTVRSELTDYTNYNITLPNIGRVIEENQSNFIFLCFPEGVFRGIYSPLRALLFVKRMFLERFSTCDKVMLVDNFICKDWGHSELTLGKIGVSKLSVRDTPNHFKCNGFQYESIKLDSHKYDYITCQAIEEVISQIKLAKASLGKLRKIKYNVISID